MPCRKCKQAGHNIKTCKACVCHKCVALGLPICGSSCKHSLQSTPPLPLPPAQPPSSYHPETAIKEVSSADYFELGVSAPEKWEKVEQNLYVLDSSSDEYRKQSKIFLKSFKRGSGLAGQALPKIKSIKRIQHSIKFMQYHLERKRMALRDNCEIEAVVEKTLFHGTSSDSVDSIARNGFNRSFGSIQAFGNGIYFARDAKLSSDHKYATPDKDGNQYIFITKVLVGHSTIGVGGMKVPPNRKKDIPFDCLVDYSPNPSIFVSGHNDNQMYAEYLVEYKTNIPPRSNHVGFLEIQNMENYRLMLYWCPPGQGIRYMTTINPNSTAYQNVGQIGDIFSMCPVHFQNGQGTSIVGAPLTILSTNNPVIFGDVFTFTKPGKLQIVVIDQKVVLL